MDELGGGAEQTRAMVALGGIRAGKKGGRREINRPWKTSCEGGTLGKGGGGIRGPVVKKGGGCCEGRISRLEKRNIKNHEGGIGWERRN